MDSGASERQKDVKTAQGASPGEKEDRADFQNAQATNSTQPTRERNSNLPGEQGQPNRGETDFLDCLIWLLSISIGCLVRLLSISLPWLIWLLSIVLHFLIWLLSSSVTTTKSLLKKYANPVKKGVVIREQKPGDNSTVDESTCIASNSNSFQHQDDKAESEIEIECPSSDAKKYLLCCVKPELEKCGVEVRDLDGEDNLRFYISGREKTLKQAMDLINVRLEGAVMTNIEFKQPGLRKFSETGDLDRQIKKIEEEEKCVIQVKRNLSSMPRDNSTSLSKKAALPSYTGGHRLVDDDSSSTVTSSEPNVLVTAHGQKISWKPGDIAKEQVDVMVIPQGECFRKIKASFSQATIQAAKQLTAGHITVSQGNDLPCKHVIHSCSSFCLGFGSSGEKAIRAIVRKALRKVDEIGGHSIAFPVIWDLGFPLHEVSRIMLDEAIRSCEKHHHRTVKDIRFVLDNGKENLIDAFQQEAKKIQNQRTKTVQRAAGRECTEIAEVVHDNLTNEMTDAIVNIIGTDMNLENAGKLSKAIAQASGPQVQKECSQMGRQSPGSAVKTSGGNLAVPYIIHIVTGSSDKQHLQSCLEASLRLADANNLQSISIPAVGTGGYGLSAEVSAQLTFKALHNISGNFTSVSKVRIVVYEAQMVQAFQKEQRNSSLHRNKVLTSLSTFGSHVTVDVTNGDLTQETTDAIVHLIGTNKGMYSAGRLSRSITRTSGSQVSQQCRQMRKLPPGSTLITSGGNLSAPHIIHIVSGSSDKQHLQSCLEAGLCLADANSLQSISIPDIGTDGYGLSANDSADIVFEALKNFSLSCANIRTVRIVISQADMIEAFHLKEEKVQEKRGFPHDSSSLTKASNNPDKPSVRVSVLGDSKPRVDKVIGELKKTFSSACVTKTVNKEGIELLSELQISHLKREAYKCNMEINIDSSGNSITVRGYPADIPDMIFNISKEIKKGIRQKQDGDNAHMISTMVEWSYTRFGKEKLFDLKTNAQLELARSKKESTAKVSLNGEEFVIDLKAKIGRGQRNSERITVIRTAKEGNLGTPFPDHWTPMPSHQTVHTVLLNPASTEYKDVMRKIQATAGGVIMNVQKIERVQNPHLYRLYMEGKLKMDKDNEGNSERQLFHGTEGRNINAINTHGFNRNFGGVHGMKWGRGVYFAKEASYARCYTGQGGGKRYMYLARVLVGHYCQGSPKFVRPPQRDPVRPDILYDSVVDNTSNPTIFVVFFDNRCYPEYLITF